MLNALDMLREYTLTYYQKLNIEFNALYLQVWNKFPLFSVRNRHVKGSILCSERSRWCDFSKYEICTLLQILYKNNFSRIHDNVQCFFVKIGQVYSAVFFFDKHMYIVRTYN